MGTGEITGNNGSMCTIDGRYTDANKPEPLCTEASTITTVSEAAPQPLDPSKTAKAFQQLTASPASTVSAANAPSPIPGISMPEFQAMLARGEIEAMPMPSVIGVSIDPITGEPRQDEVAEVIRNVNAMDPRELQAAYAAGEPLIFGTPELQQQMNVNMQETFLLAEASSAAPSNVIDSASLPSLNDFKDFTNKLDHTTLHVMASMGREPTGLLGTTVDLADRAFGFVVWDVARPSLEWFLHHYAAPDLMIDEWTKDANLIMGTMDAHGMPQHELTGLPRAITRAGLGVATAYLSSNIIMRTYGKNVLAAGGRIPTLASGKAFAWYMAWAVGFRVLGTDMIYTATVLNDNPIEIEPDFVNYDSFMGFVNGWGGTAFIWDKTSRISLWVGEKLYRLAEGDFRRAPYMMVGGRLLPSTVQSLAGVNLNGRVAFNIGQKTLHGKNHLVAGRTESVQVDMTLEGPHLGKAKNWLQFMEDRGYEVTIEIKRKEAKDKVVYEQDGTTPKRDRSGSVRTKAVSELTPVRIRPSEISPTLTGRSNPIPVVREHRYFVGDLEMDGVKAKVTVKGPMGDVLGSLGDVKINGDIKITVDGAFVQAHQDDFIALASQERPVTGIRGAKMPLGLIDGHLEQVQLQLDARVAANHAGLLRSISPDGATLQRWNLGVVEAETPEMLAKWAAAPAGEKVVVNVSGDRLKQQLATLDAAGITPQTQLKVYGDDALTMPLKEGLAALETVDIEVRASAIRERSALFCDLAGVTGPTELALRRRDGFRTPNGTSLLASADGRVFGVKDHERVRLRVSRDALLTRRADVLAVDNGAKLNLPNAVGEANAGTLMAYRPVEEAIFRRPLVPNTPGMGIGGRSAAAWTNFKRRTYNALYVPYRIASASNSRLKFAMTSTVGALVTAIPVAYFMKGQEGYTDNTIRVMEGVKTGLTGPLNRGGGPYLKMSAMREGLPYTNFDIYKYGTPYLHLHGAVINMRLAISEYHKRAARHLMYYAEEPWEMASDYANMRKATTVLEEHLAKGRDEAIIKDFGKQVKIMQAREASVRAWARERGVILDPAHPDD